MTTSTSSVGNLGATTLNEAKIKTRLAALASMALGASFVFIIGFSQIAPLHNAAHDTRHSFAFPCH